MASDKNGKGSVFQRSPSQAHRIFGFAGDQRTGTKFALGAPRPRFLFLVRFIRSPGGTSDSSWQSGLHFAVKQVGRPGVTADTQVMNQYNKKRIIQTGLKYAPVKVEFHDTTDQMVMQMWHEYASYYFGDFRKVTDVDWSYDLTNPDYHNTGGTGFGLTLPNEQQNAVTKDSPVGFFSKLECYQFSGGSYTQYDLINPKISSFNADEMDYGSDLSHGLTMTFEYEAIIYQNNNKPRLMSDATANEFIKSLAKDPYFVGNVYEPADDQYTARRTSDLPAETRTVPAQYNSFGAVGNSINQNAGNMSSISNIANTLRNGSIISQALPQNASSALASFGNFNFGQAATQTLTSKLNQSLAGKLPGNLTNALTSKIPSVMNSVIGQSLNNVNTSRGVSASNYDVARGEAQVFGDDGSDFSVSSQAYADSVVEDSVVGTMYTPVDSGSDDYDDWV